ncbi:acyl-CoA dehydrogenase [Actinomadura sp. CNU-125]|uniref:acyl-CoA dehydrogenase family protein n=1 Tax=Actinomadura sp. CNU-125 TaxID=1904961 RepID=UPI000965CB74|nr:acyl-CoA dehydrogenase family protein [Actinomadura sp. CNU-125]OLT20840.1 acyl-CoA dehydrogenase [Actinomadura sp. CNU-125]
MSLLYTEVESDLRATVRDVLADRCPPGTVLALIDQGAPCDSGLWSTLAEDVGVAGLLIPESLGGMGASPREAAVVLEELGRAVAPVPFLTSAVLATTLLLRAGTPEADKHLADLATGASTAAVAVSLAAHPHRPGRPGAEAPVARDGRVSGVVRGVAGTESADVLFVPVDGAVHAVTDFAVDTVTSLDLTRPIATVTLDAAPAVPVCDDPGALPFALACTAGLLASEQLGVAEWCLDTTVAYAKERKQFARPIGSFQALKHRLADLWLDLVRTRAAARSAADHLAGALADPDLTGSAPAEQVRTSIAVAQSWCGPVAVHAAEECVQIHGGIGMTWEHPAHLYLKRAKADSIALGTVGDHHDALAELADVPSPA